MQTKNGTKVTELKFIKDANIYVGLVNGKPMTWQNDGRRAKKRRSKLDLMIAPNKTKIVYVHVCKWGDKLIVRKEQYSSFENAIKEKKRGHIKTISVEI